MKLQDIFDQLTAGEFSQLSIGGEDAGAINENNYARVLTHVNLGLAALYRRFHLKENTILLKVLPGVTSYILNSQYGQANKRPTPPQEQRYILDAAAPFKDDILKMTKVTLDSGRELVLNEHGNPLSCLTPKLESLVIPQVVASPTLDTPEWLRTTNLSLTYRANHARIVVPVGLFDPNRYELELPYAYLEALLYFIAARAQGPVGLNNEFNASVRYTQKYEAACAELHAMNIEVDQVGVNHKLHRKGFV